MQMDTGRGPDGDVGFGRVTAHPNVRLNAVGWEGGVLFAQTAVGRECSVDIVYESKAQGSQWNTNHLGLLTLYNLCLARVAHYLDRTVPLRPGSNPKTTWL